MDVLIVISCKTWINCKENGHTRDWCDGPWPITPPTSSCGTTQSEGWHTTKHKTCFLKNAMGCTPLHYLSCFCHSSYIFSVPTKPCFLCLTSLLAQRTKSNVPTNLAKKQSPLPQISTPPFPQKQGKKNLAIRTISNDHVTGDLCAKQSFDSIYAGDYDGYPVCRSFRTHVPTGG